MPRYSNSFHLSNMLCFYTSNAHQNFGKSFFFFSWLRKSQKHYFKLVMFQPQSMHGSTWSSGYHSTCKTNLNFYNKLYKVFPNSKRFILKGEKRPIKTHLYFFPFPTFPPLLVIQTKDWILL